MHCFLSDSFENDFNEIVLSIICERLYFSENREITIEECYRYCVEDLSLLVERDVFTKAIEKSTYFKISPLKEDLLIKLTSSKFSELRSRISDASIDKYIAEFLKRTGGGQDEKNAILGILYQAIYDNIHSISASTLKTLLQPIENSNFSKHEIDTYNQFIEYDDHKKNEAVYRLFVRSIEFAILTSGKGVKRFSKDIFVGKSYLVDTNVFFRLLGVGGDGRQKALLNLIKLCVYQGIRFYYTAETYIEWRQKLQSTVQQLNKPNNKRNLLIIQELAGEKEFTFNDSFILHYANLRLKKIISSPQQYEVKLRSEFDRICKQFDIEQIDPKIAPDKGRVNFLANSFFDRKRSLNESSHYTNAAAIVDATNILYVRSLRGHNNYNYTDVKSFYLTTDRTLNRIVSAENPGVVAETILPSQLFILHNPLSSEDDGVDYDTFVSFLRKRTTEYNYNADEVIEMIQSVSHFTKDEEQIIGVIRAYSDKRYELTHRSDETHETIETFDDFAKSHLEEELEAMKHKAEKQNMFHKKANEDILIALRKSQQTTKIIDALIVVGLIPVSLIIARLFVTNIFILLAVVVLFELLKTLVSNKFRFLAKLWKFLFMVRIKSSPYFVLSDGDPEYLKEATRIFDETKGDVWKRTERTN